MCPNFCMMYYLENAELVECSSCGHSRYKPRTSRGRTLVAHDAMDRGMVHPSNGEA
jgi:Zn ribbon nucleic-acid-binding protein